MKRIVVCCDGTWSTPDQRSQGRSCPTNVTKLALAVASQDRQGTEQRLYYHPGVGTRRWERLGGGAFGLGVSRDVLSAYRFVVHNFEPGDELFFFGFSRGAFTARSTAGFIRNVGVLRRENLDRVEEAYALYRDRATGPHDIQAALFRRSYSFETPIRFIGVWDTVGALGIPWSGVPLINLINRRWSFHDTRLSRTVQGAFQALAIDEARRPFEPAIWDSDPAALGQRVEQVWFAGVHCDVGGGYPDGELADVALLWMADRAREYGLALTEGSFTAAGGWGAPDSNLPAVRACAMAAVHNSRKGFYRLLPPFVRRIGAVDPSHESLASTAELRHQDDPAYTPAALLTYLDGAGHVTDVKG